MQHLVVLSLNSEQILERSSTTPLWGEKNVSISTFHWSALLQNKSFKACVATFIKSR